MPAVICYVTDVSGREVQLRVRASGRIAIPLTDMPSPPGELVLRCDDVTVELRLLETRFGYAVYYVPAADFDRLVWLIRVMCQREPCGLPCRLVPPQGRKPDKALRV
jgi:hypothetical protein